MPRISQEGAANAAPANDKQTAPLKQRRRLNAKTERPKLSKDVVRRPVREQHATNHTIGQDHPRLMRSTGDARESLEPSIIEPVDGPLHLDHIEKLRFANEFVDVMVADSTDQNPEPFVDVWVEGRVQRFWRGQVTNTQRKYVEVLARARLTRIRQQMVKDQQGFDAIRNDRHSSLRYPFSVLNDTNPNGAAWLRALMNEG